MSPVKSRSRANTTKKAETGKKGSRQQKNGRRNGSKVPQPPSTVPNGKQRGRGNSPTTEKLKKHDANSKGTTKKKDEHRKRGIEQEREPQKEKGTKLANGRIANGRSQPQGERGNGTKGGIDKAVSSQPVPKTATTKTGRISAPSAKTVNKRGGREIETEEEESESDGGSSSEVSEEDECKDEEEELGRNEEPVETHGSEESNEEEAVVSNKEKDTERDTEGPSEGEESDKELVVEVETGGGPEENPNATSEEEEEKEEEVEGSEAVTSDGGGEDEITEEKTSEKPATDKASRHRRQIPRPLEHSEGRKYKMFKKTKADKQAEKAEKQRAKAEKQRAEKEAKQKAKDEKKNKKRLQKEDKQPSPEHEEEDQPLTGVSLNKADTAKGKAQLLQLANKTKNIKEKNVPPEPEPEEEEEEAAPTLAKATKGQARMMLIKAKGKDLKADLETQTGKEEEQEAGSGVKGRRQSLLLGKVKMTSIRLRTDKMLEKSGEEMLESEAADGESTKPRERLIARRKGVTALRRVSGWIQKKGFNLKKKFAAWSRAIGISRWLSLRALKQKDRAKKSKGNILKHRMAMRVTSKTSLASTKSRNSTAERRAKEKAVSQGNAEDGGEEVAPAGEKEVEAKYAVVLPRMNKLGLGKAPQAAPVGSTPGTSTGTPGGSTTSDPKPPKPGARLVLPVKPDLSLLKSIQKPLPGGLKAGGEAERTTGSSATTAAPVGSPDTDDGDRKVALDNQNGVSVLQAARGRLGSSQINLTKMSLSGGMIGAAPNRTRAPEPERETPARTPRPTTEPPQNGEPAGGVSGVGSVYEEEADWEVAHLMGEGELYTVGPPEVHWAGTTRMSGDPQV